LTEPSTSVSAGGASGARSAGTALEAKMQELRGRVAELSSRLPTTTAASRSAGSSKKDEGSLNTLVSVGNSSSASSSTEEGELVSMPEPLSSTNRLIQSETSSSVPAAAGSGAIPGSTSFTTISAQLDSSTSTAASSLTITAPDSSTSRPAPTLDPRRRLPLPASTLKSMFVTRPSKSSTSSTSTSVPTDGTDPHPVAAAGTIPQVQPFSSRPVPLGNKEQKGIDRERAAAIHKSARRESEAQHAAAAALGSEAEVVAMSMQEEEQPVSLATEQSNDRDEQGGSEDSAMHDLFSGDDDEEDGVDDAEGLPESIATREVADSENVQGLQPSSARDQEARERELRSRLLKKRVREDEIPGISAATSPPAMSTESAADPDTADSPAPVVASAGQKKRRIIGDDEEPDEALPASLARAAQSMPSIHPPPPLPITDSQRSSTPSSQSSTPGGGRSSRKLIPVVEIITTRRSIVARKTTGGSRKKPSTSTSADNVSSGVPAVSSSAYGQERTVPPASPSGIKLKLKMSSSASSLPGTGIAAISASSSSIREGDSGEVTRRSVVQEEDEEMQDASQSRDIEKSLFTPSPTPEQAGAAPIVEQGLVTTPPTSNISYRLRL